MFLSLVESQQALKTVKINMRKEAQHTLNTALEQRSHSLHNTVKMIHHALLDSINHASNVVNLSCDQNDIEIKEVLSLLIMLGYEVFGEESYDCLNITIKF